MKGHCFNVVIAHSGLVGAESMHVRFVDEEIEFVDLAITGSVRGGENREIEVMSSPTVEAQK